LISMLTSTFGSRYGNASKQVNRLATGFNSITSEPSSKQRINSVYFSGLDSSSDQFGVSFRPGVYKLLNVDISGTFTKAPEYFKQQFEDERNASILNTGRSLEYLQQPGKLHELKLADAVADFLATDNGMTLYWNKDRLTLEKWIPHLTPDSQVSKFKATMESAFNSTPEDIKEKVLQPVSQEFIKRFPNLSLFLKFKAGIKTKCTLSITDEHAAEFHKHFKQALNDRLCSLKIKADILEEERQAKDSSCIETKYTVAPGGYTKLSPIEFIMATICTQVKEVESYGNNLNDLEVVSRPHILEKSHSCHIIPGGSNAPSLRESLKDKNHIKLWETVQDFLHHLLR